MFETKKIILNEWQKTMYDMFVNTWNMVNDSKLGILNSKSRDLKLIEGYQNLIYQPNEFLRGLGKSYLCMYIADKFKYDMFVETSANLTVRMEYAKHFGFNIKVYNIHDDVKGHVFSEVVILDDIFIKNINIIKDIGIKNMIGFVI